MVSKTPTYEQLAYDEGYREGVIRTHTRAIERAAIALFLQEASSISASILSEGLRASLKAVKTILGTVTLRAWREVLERLLEPVMEDAAAPQEPILGVGFDLSRPFMRDYFQAYTQRVAKEIVDASRDAATKLLKGIDEEITAGQDITDSQAALRVRQKLEQAAPSRAQRIARTELRRAANGANYLQVVESGFYSTKTHIHQHDTRVRDEHYFIETVPVDKPYQNGEMFAGELSVNCRCHDTFAIKSLEDQEV